MRCSRFARYNRIIVDDMPDFEPTIGELYLIKPIYRPQLSIKDQAILDNKTNVFSNVNTRLRLYLPPKIAETYFEFYSDLKIGREDKYDQFIDVPNHLLHKYVKARGSIHYWPNNTKQLFAIDPSLIKYIPNTTKVCKDYLDNGGSICELVDLNTDVINYAAKLSYDTDVPIKITTDLQGYMHSVYEACEKIGNHIILSILPIVLPKDNLARFIYIQIRESHEAIGVAIDIGPNTIKYLLIRNPNYVSLLGDAQVKRLIEMDLNEYIQENEHYKELLMINKTKSAKK